MTLTTSVSLSGDDLTLADVWAVAVDGAGAELADEGRRKLAAARELVERIARSEDGEHTYGINTGFGRFVSVASEGARGGVGSPVFAAAMGGTISMMKGLATDYRGTGVTDTVTLAMASSSDVWKYVARPLQGPRASSAEISPPVSFSAISASFAWVSVSPARKFRKRSLSVGARKAW